MTKIAVFQMTSGIDPDENASSIVKAIGGAAEGGAQIIFTPEMSGLLDRNRERAGQHIMDENANPVLAAVRSAAAAHGIWVSVGSLAVSNDDGRWVNRSFLVDDKGQIAARYDKIHMFDVTLATGEAWRESAAYAPGETVVTANSPVGLLGFAICYDVRFPALFEALGRKKCDVIQVPAAFTVPTGKAHWHLLLRARAVEASAYVVAAAQVGEHADGRRTFGHSLVVDPWGDVILDMDGEASGVGFAVLDPHRIREIRQQLPSLANRKDLPKSA